MSPVSQPDGHDAPWLVDDGVPSLAAQVEELVIGGEDSVGEEIVAHELPEVFDRIQLGRFWRQRQEGDVLRDLEAFGHVPSGLIENEDGVFARGDCGGDLHEMKVHGFCVAARQDESRPFSLLRADRPEDVGRDGALIVRRRGAGSALGPASGDLVLLADAGLVGEPDLYVIGREALVGGDFVQAGGETFLKSSMACVSCA